MYQLIIFDWDGTLMDSTQKIANCVIASARELKLKEPSVNEAKNIIGLGLYEAMIKLFPEASHTELSRLVALYKHHWLNVDTTSQALFTGVASGLEKLDGLGPMLAVATGKSRAGLDRILDETGLKQRFTITRCGDETRSKPHPLMVEQILEFTTVSPDKAIMVGDTTYDMDLANNAGISSVGVSYGVHSASELKSHGAIEVFNSFSEVLDWFENGKTESALA